MNMAIGILMAVAILAVMVWIFVGSSRRKWYKVYLANNEILLLYRDFRERWWRTNNFYIRFKDEQGNEITFPSNAHWVLMWESVKPELLDFVREEILRRKEDLAKREEVE